MQPDQPARAAGVQADAACGWIAPEVERSLDAAAAALDANANGESLALPPDALAPARAALALVRGALEMVSCEEALAVVRETDALLAHCAPGVDGWRAGVGLCRRACTELRAHLAVALRGQPHSGRPLDGLLRELLAANGKPEAAAPEEGPEASAVAAAAADQRHRLRERVAALQSAWEQYAGGDADALSAARAQLAELSLAALPHLALARLVGELQAAVGLSAAAPAAAVTRELAVALLFLDDVLAAGSEADSAVDAQVTAVMQRVQAALAGRIDARAQRVDLRPEPVRSHQERALAASLSRELLTLLHAAEQRLVAYFEDGAQRDSLDLAGKWLRQVSSVLGLAGTDARLARAAAFCAEHVGRWAAGQTAPQPEETARVAAAFCGLSYCLENLQFAATDFAAVMRRAGAPEQLCAEQAEAAVEPGLQAVPEQAMPEQAGPEQAGPTAPADAASAPEAAADVPTDRPSDPEMLQVFLEEAREVLHAVAGELDALERQPSNSERLGVVRRAFHTLKGSGRMVELNHVGEAAWAVEQLLNGVLQRGQPAGPDLLRLLRLAVARLHDWVGQLQELGRAGVDSHMLLDWAERLKRGEPLPQDDEPVQGAPGKPAGASLATRASELATAVPAKTVEIGRARVSAELFATFLAEAAEHVATLDREVGALRDSAAGAASYESFRAAHTLGGIAGTIGIPPLSELAGQLERVLQLLHHRPRRLPADELALVAHANAELATMLGVVRGLRAPEPATQPCRGLEALADRLLAESGGLDGLQAVLSAEVSLPDPAGTSAAVTHGASAESVTAVPSEAELAERRRNRIADDIDGNLLPLFLEEATELVPQIGQDLRDWRAAPAERSFPESLKRSLHTLKGSARMAGAMGLGELTHSIETRVADAAGMASVPETLFDALEASFDRIGVLLEQLERGEAEAVAPPSQGPGAAGQPAAAAPDVQPRALLRVRADLVDRLVDEAGEVSIARSRMEGELRSMRNALHDLTDTVIRMRNQVREVEIQAESQLQSRMAHAQAAAEPFDPLELDRFTRLQELTRFLAETGSDVSALQQGILSGLDGLEGALTAQRRMTRVLQDGLMRVRLVPFGRLADRLHRVARLTARESGKRVALDIRGGQVELERGVIERIAAPLEHMLRNAIVHGVETPAERRQAGKRETGAVRLEVRQEGNEVVLVLSDDGRGLDLGRIRDRARAAGLLGGDQEVSDDEAAQLVFMAGISTAEHVTEAAGRGVGLDVVRTDIGSLGGRLQLAFQAGQGTTFTIYLPLTLSVVQALLVRSGDQVFALPAPMVEQVQKVRPELLLQLFAAGQVTWQERTYPVHALQHLLGSTEHAPALNRYNAVVLLRSGAQRAAIHVDELLGNQEIVVKSIGAQLARVTGIAGAAVLGSGRSVLILNPVLLTQSAPGVPARAPAPSPELVPEPPRPAVMVIDDSLTIRRITGRLLSRAGYEVIEARDGVDAIEQLRGALPQVLLMDIEMPRMDGFELTRHVRGDPRLRHIPIIVISSRTAEKHRQHAAELGVNLFLGKPFQEDELLAHIAGFVAGLPDAAAAA